MVASQRPEAVVPPPTLVTTVRLPFDSVTVPWLVVLHVGCHQWTFSAPMARPSAPRTMRVGLQDRISERRQALVLLRAHLLDGLRHLQRYLRGLLLSLWQGSSPRRASNPPLPCTSLASVSALLAAPPGAGLRRGTKGSGVLGLPSPSMPYARGPAPSRRLVSEVGMVVGHIGIESRP